MQEQSWQRTVKGPGSVELDKDNWSSPSSQKSSTIPKQRTVGLHSSRSLLSKLPTKLSSISSVKKGT